MLKKTGVVALGVVATLFLLSCTQLGSYMCTYLKQVREAAVKQVPVEVVIQNLRDEVAAIDPDIRKNQTIVAEEIVSVEKLRAEVENGKKKLALQKEQLSAI